MYGYGANHNKLIKSAREKIPGFFVAFRRRGWRSGVVGGVPRRYRNTGQQGDREQGDREQGDREQGDKNGIYSRALRKLQRKPFKITSKNGNFTQNTKIFAEKLAQSENLPYLCSVKKKNQNIKPI